MLTNRMGSRINAHCGYVRRMRRSVGPIVVLAVLCAAAPARAGEVSLWACRGPDGGRARAPVTTAVERGRRWSSPACAAGAIHATRPGGGVGGVGACRRAAGDDADRRAARPRWRAGRATAR